MVGIMEYFDVWHIGGRETTEARVKEKIASAVAATAITQNTEDVVKKFDIKLNSRRRPFGEASGNISGQAAGQSRQPTASLQLQARGVRLS
jgi:hypothetical protein